MAIQYNTIRIKEIEKPDKNLSEQLILWGKIFDNLWMAPYVDGKGSAGNIGFRGPNGIHVTPSGGSLGNLTTDDIMTITKVEQTSEVNVYFYGHKDKKPTSEGLIYWDIFQKRKDISVILHGHDLLSTEKAEELRKNHPEFIDITPSITEAGSPEFREEISDILNQNSLYLIGRGHGFFALGQTFDEAGILSLKLRTEAMHLFLGSEIERLKERYNII